jgi:hypothetical protein
MTDAEFFKWAFSEAHKMRMREADHGHVFKSLNCLHCNLHLNRYRYLARHKEREAACPALVELTLAADARMPPLRSPSGGHNFDAASLACLKCGLPRIAFDVLPPHLRENLRCPGPTNKLSTEK